MREQNQLQEIKGFSPDKIQIINKLIDRKPEMFDFEAPYTSNLEYDQLIQISVLKRERNSGTVKKMLYVPTMALYVVKEQQILTQES